jgi:hypothetical protein
MGTKETGDQWVEIEQLLDAGQYIEATDVALQVPKDVSDATEEQAQIFDLDAVEPSPEDCLKVLRSIAVDQDRNDISQKITDILANL